MQILCTLVNSTDSFANQLRNEGYTPLYAYRFTTNKFNENRNYSKETIITTDDTKVSLHFLHVL